MKYLAWNQDKNDWLKLNRGVTFEQVISAAFNGKVLAEGLNPNQKKYPNHKIWLIEINDYAYVVPFIEDEIKIFLKTIIPSRKYTREFIEKENL